MRKAENCKSQTKREDNPEDSCCKRRDVIDGMQ
jgi:hypothetical protein